MEDYNLRKAVGVILFDLLADINRYQKRGGNNKKVIREVLDIFLKALTPFVPHVCEECWELLGNRNLVSAQQIPKVSSRKINIKLESEEEYVHQVLRDIDEIRKIANSCFTNKQDFVNKWNHILGRSI